MVPVATGIANCYENSRPPPHAVIPAKACPVLRYRAGIQSQALGFQSTLERRGAHTFIPLCGLRKALVIPAPDPGFLPQELSPIHPLNHAISPPSAVLSNFGKALPAGAACFTPSFKLTRLA